ncbi:winged helix-turn-helix transcriptional regulator [Gloeocapsa sp. PCC 73106]|uniref:winged helix-turn-helix transcriptional regulator n=1 Tax=Gloeocapsa sp. PCC 73106 TaxID=102232 RepID=UPI00031902D2
MLNECLKRLIDYTIFNKVSYAEIPPRIEYFLTDFGQEFLERLYSIKEIQIKSGKN